MGSRSHYFHKLANQILKEHPDIIAFYVGNWNKIETVSNTGMKPIDRRINRQVQNNNPIGKLIEYLSYKARMQCKGG